MAIVPEIKSESEYRRLRAICDKAAAYWEANATHGRQGSSMSAELAAHPDYAACSNEIRGKVDQWETLRDLPERLSAYIGEDSSGRPIVTVWTGLPLGSARVVSSWPTPRSWQGSRRYAYRAMIGGREFAGTGFGKGMFINLRETAESRRNRESS